MAADLINGQLMLSFEETERLIACESVIEQGLRTFIEVGNALFEIRDSRLYRQDFDTFESYCRDRWKMSYRRSKQLMDAATVVANLNHGSETPTSERQVRPLTRLEPAQQREAWELAKTISPNPTAADTERAVKIVKRALDDAYNDACAEAKVSTEARRPIPGKPNPVFDDRWIEMVGAVSRIMRIEPFDAKAIASQQLRVSDSVGTKEQILKCQQAVARISAFISEL
jgi:hypothetical protein